MFALSAWAVAPGRHRRDGGRVLLALWPFAVALGLNLVLRVSQYGGLGGYTNTRSDYITFFWDNFTAYMRVLLVPLNPEVVGQPAVQLVGLAVSAALLAGLVWFGRAERRLLVLCVVWVVLGLLPVLNLPIVAENLQSARYIYLAAGGYCAGVALLLYEAAAYLRRTVVIAGAVGLLLLLGVAICWVQLRPWHTATVQVDDIVSRLAESVPPQHAAQGTLWFAQDVPQDYLGTRVFSKGLGRHRALLYRDEVTIDEVQSAEEAPLVADPHDDVFTMRFTYDEATQRFPIEYLAGITHYTPPPSADDTAQGKGLKVWDFTGCSAESVGAWKPYFAEKGCTPGRGMVVDPQTADPQLIADGLDIDPDSAGSDERFVRIRVAVRYPGLGSTEPRFMDWFWRGANDNFSERGFMRLNVKQDDRQHVYWLYVPVARIGSRIESLRFDPLNFPVPAEVAWIAVDTVR
jgi:hypothetical protein